MKLGVNKIIGLIPISVRENHGVTQVQSIRKKVWNRKNSTNLSFNMSRNIVTKEDRRFLQVRSLT
jgi:hypothetical protein